MLPYPSLLRREARALAGAGLVLCVAQRTYLPARGTHPHNRALLAPRGPRQGQEPTSGAAVAGTTHRGVQSNAPTLRLCSRVGDPVG